MNRIALCRIGAAVLIVLVLTSCSPAPTRNAGTSSKTGIPGDAPNPLPPAKPPMDVGDVESMLTIFASLDEQSKTPTVTVDEMTDMRNQVDLVTLGIAPPFPNELWISFRVISRGGFAEVPVVLRGKVLRDNDAIGSFATVLGADAATKPYAYRIDALAGLSSPPETMLIHAQAEVILMPSGTDPVTTDAAKVVGTKETTGAVLSNPVRINFGNAGAKP